MSADLQTTLNALSSSATPAKFTTLVESIVSPMHIATENELWRVDSEDTEPRVLRKLHKSSLDEFSSDSMVEATITAGELGVGPKVLAADSQTGSLLLPLLGEKWRSAYTFDLKKESIRLAVIEAAKKFQSGPPLSHSSNPFVRLHFLSKRASAVQAPLPSDIEWLLEEAMQVEKATNTLPFEKRPCRNDGCASNIMIHEDGSVLLIDFDLAGMNDPAFDLGVLLAEAAEFDDEAMEWVRLWCGKPSSRLLARARLYGAVDDLCWAMSAAINAHISDRVSLEFRKYSEWRFMRCRDVISNWSFEWKLRQVSEVY